MTEDKSLIKHLASKTMDDLENHGREHARGFQLSSIIQTIYLDIFVIRKKRMRSQEILAESAWKCMFRYRITSRLGAKVCTWTLIIDIEWYKRKSPSKVFLK